MYRDRVTYEWQRDDEGNGLRYGEDEKQIAEDRHTDEKEVSYVSDSGDVDTGSWLVLFIVLFILGLAVIWMRLGAKIIR